ncbi:hypothetical protein BGX27_008188 [Mortierella sp. AM989]|nr:hypothetical protein BGX27_008188 [Mortierella sp. AM989]
MMAKSPSGAPYTRYYTKSLSAGESSQQPHRSPQPHFRRAKTSLSALANIDHNGRFVHHILSGSGSNNDPKDPNSTICINIRFVSRDLWARVEIPRNISVQTARDLVLEKCHLAMVSPSIPSSATDTAVGDDESISTATTKQPQESHQYQQQKQSQAIQELRSEARVESIEQEPSAQSIENTDDPQKTSTRRPRSKSTSKSSSRREIRSSHSEESITNSIKSGSRIGSDVRRSLASIDDKDIQQKNAALLMARLDMFTESVHGFGVEPSRTNYVKVITAQQRLQQGNNHGHDRIPASTSQPNNLSGSAKAHQHLKRLLSNNSVPSENTHDTSPSDRINREGGNSRLGNIPVWSNWRDRHNSHSGKSIDRDTPDIGEPLVECPNHGHVHQNEAAIKDCEAWKASFGLFWVATGHWLDDSRTINSYNLQSQDLLELQLRNQYIQLPPEGTTLNYYDHYAEGILYKLSKKNRPVSLLTGNGNRESQGIWKERWVVLQGSKLFIYHKRKDTNKKIIDIPLDLTVMTRTLPSSSRPFFKVASSTAGNMSSTMIVLDISRDPMEPKLCFRGTSQHDISHWVRIFNSLNSSAPPSSPLLGAGLGSPNSGGYFDVVSARTENSTSLTSALAGYTSERKRNHTFNTHVTTVPLISPALISNAKAAISSMNNMNGVNNSATSSSPPKTLNSHYRNGGLASHHNVLKLEKRDLNLPQHHPMSSVSTKEDIRRRAITEPNRLRLMNPPPIPNQQRGYPKHASKELDSLDMSQLSPRILDVSNVSEAPFQLDSPPGRKRKPVLGTEYLDNASQVLLASSSARSSTAPFYSGYIWLYLPNSRPDTPKTGNEKEPSSDIQLDGDVQHDFVATSKEPSDPSLATSPLVASPISSSEPQNTSSVDSIIDENKSTGSGSGRYVKCFALISDLGHFQWVEVKKLNDQETSEQELQTKTRGLSSPTSSRSSYGIQLKSQRQAPVDHDYAPEGPKHELLSEMSPKPGSCEESVQVSMMESVNMFFFCVKISPSIVNDVLLDVGTVETSSPPPHAHSFPTTLSFSPNAIASSAGVEVESNSPTHQPSIAASAAGAAAKAAIKIRHRLSSSLSTLTTSATASAAAAAALPPLPTLGGKSQSMSGSISKGKNLNWSSITPPLSYDTDSLPDQNQPSRQNQPDRATTVPPIGQSSSNRPVTHKGSLASLKFGHSSITTTAVQQQRSETGNTESGFLATNYTPTPLFASPTSAEPLSPRLVIPSSPTPSNSSSVSSSSSSGRVLSLAQNLQEAAMMNRQLSSSGEGRSNVEQQENSTLNVPSSCISSPSSNSNSSGFAHGALAATATTVAGVRPRITLSETMVANQSAFPDSAASLERNKQTPELLEMNQRVQRAEERVRAKEQQYQQQKENKLLNAQKQQQQHRQQQQQKQQQQQQQPQQQQPQQQLQQPQQSLRPQQSHNPLPKLQTKVDNARISNAAKNSCPFLELSEDADMDESGQPFMLLRGYTESEAEWKALQSALDRFLDGSIKKQSSALPPQDTLIPSYHSPAEVKLSEKAERFLNAKESMIEVANLAASKAAVDAARSPTPDMFSGGTIPTANGPVAQIRATSVSMTRWMNLSGGKDRGRVDRDNHGNKAKINSLTYPFPDQIASRMAHLEDDSPILPATTTRTFNLADTFEPLAKEGSDVSAKRGFSPSHSLSVGSGSSLFRPRPRLNQQRSVDELTKTSPSIAAVNSGDKGEQETSNLMGQAKGVMHSQHAALYSTATAMMHSNNDRDGSNVNVGNASQSHRLKSILKGRTTPLCDEEEYQVGKSSSPVSPKRENNSLGHGLKIGPRSLSLSSASATTVKPWEETNNQLAGTTIAATATTRSRTGDFEDGKGAERMTLSSGKFEFEGDVGDESSRRDSKSSIQSLYTRAQQLAIQEVENSKSKRMDSRSNSNDSACNDANTTLVEEEEEEEEDERSPSGGESPVEDLAVPIATLPAFPIMDKKDVGLHPLEQHEGGHSSGSSETAMKRAPGSSDSGNSRKHQTVLGAGKAAVSGVFGKFRKSVG